MNIKDRWQKLFGKAGHGPLTFWPRGLQLSVLSLHSRVKTLNITPVQQSLLERQKIQSMLVAQCPTTVWSNKVRPTYRTVIFCEHLAKITDMGLTYITRTPAVPLMLSHYHFFNQNPHRAPINSVTDRTLKYIPVVFPKQWQRLISSSSQDYMWKYDCNLL